MRLSFLIDSWRQVTTNVPPKLRRVAKSIVSAPTSLEWIKMDILHPTVKIGDQERFDKEQIGDKEQF